MGATLPAAAGSVKGAARDGRVAAEHHDGDRLDHVVLADSAGNELCVV